MGSVAPSADNTADFLQKLSLNPDSNTIEVPESAKTGYVFSTGQANGMAKPFNPNTCFVPNAYPSTTYYYGGYDGQGNDWNAYSRYMNIDGGMAQGVYGDSCSYIYHQGYGYSPYGAYPPPGSSTPTMQHQGQPYGLQQYQYPCPYYQSPASNAAVFSPNKTSATQGEMLTSSVAMNKGNYSSIINSDCTNDIKALLSGSQNSSLNPNDSHQRAGLPAYVPLSGYQGPKFNTDGTLSTISPSASSFSARQFKNGARAGLSSQVMPAKDFSSQRNQILPQPLPQFTNLPGSRPSSGLEMVSGFMNRMYPNEGMYNSRLGYAVYGSRTGSVDNRLKATRNNYEGVDHGKKNKDGFSELNKGPRAKSSDSKNGKGLGPVTLLVKGQSLPIRSDNKELPLVPSKEQYNSEESSENYSDANFFVIKSYSEDDVHKSIKYSVWASTPNGNKKLDTAYQEAKAKPGGCSIFLLFSVNTSGQFVGLAEMVGPVDFERTVEYWQQDKWTGCFPVKWHIIKDIPNSVLRHITLENNENKPVTNSRDTQEVKFEKGIEILKIFKAHSSKTCILDDFGFYEARELTIQERKSREQLFQKQVSKPSDLSTSGKVALPESFDGTLVDKSASADASERGNVEVKLSEENGLKTTLEDSRVTVPDRKVTANGVASVC
ncbi:hypothetical protein L6164_004831 [Bauhinia variegata]|uniref:Uncharacterized protein n=1 Tax=Bauhinia variegata TaxID=167791 RepID=A0ACB9PNH5_BAUVA|nr:hypothetical protein L6164_004831 [Bauhinia variegata]